MSVNLKLSIYIIMYGNNIFLFGLKTKISMSLDDIYNIVLAINYVLRQLHRNVCILEHVFK